MSSVCRGGIMKTASIFKAMTTGLLIILLLALPAPGQSQENGEEAASEAFTNEQLAQMLAPIALYPDALLSQVLMASTYPLEVIEADRWVKKHEQLKGDSLDDSLQDKNWDPSVKSLCHFPSVLSLMSEKITETTSLGNAFLAQENEVMDVIQKLRAEAYKQGNLTSTSEQKVTKKEETIIIEPAYPNVVYVPYYNPLYVYGTWWYPAYPPYYWGPFPVVVGAGISFWPGPFVNFSLVSWSYFDWPHHSIYINIHERPRYFRHHEWNAMPGPWYHSPKHRRGVAYYNKLTARKYGKSPARTGTFGRDIRGFPERNETAEKNREYPLKNRIQRPADRGDSTVRDQRARSDQDRKTREGIEQKKRITEERVKGSGTLHKEKTYERKQDNVFNNIGDGGEERRSSNRGRFSRESSHGNVPARSPAGRYDRGRRNR
jgi:hypothetical protein